MHSIFAGSDATVKEMQLSYICNCNVVYNRKSVLIVREMLGSSV